MVYVVMDFGKPIAVCPEYWTALGIAKGLRPDDPESCIAEVQVAVAGDLA